MCNVPCSICGDFETCEIKHSKLYKFKVFEKGIFKLIFIGTRNEALQFNFYNPEYTLILDQEEDPSPDNPEIL